MGDVGCAASLAVAPLLDGPLRRVHVLHRSTAGWQLADDQGRVVAYLTSPGTLRLPHAVVVPNDVLAPQKPARPHPPAADSTAVSLGAGQVHVGTVRLRVARWWRPARPRVLDLASWVDCDGLGSLLRTWRSELGRGDGLTPYADDVLCGSLVALLAAGHPAGTELAAAVDAADLEVATTATSAGLLRQAVHGLCIDQLAQYLVSLPRSRAEQESRQAALADVGHSSGRGLIEGVHRVITAGAPLRQPPVDPSGGAGGAGGAADCAAAVA
jgi:Protein of unknown function (DUF2877)